MNWFRSIFSKWIGQKHEPINLPFKKVAIVIGHNNIRGGAYAKGPINASEFAYNSQVAKKMVELAPEWLDISIFKRVYSGSYSSEIDRVYSNVNAIKPDIALELHFNWLNGAGRVEMLHYPKSSKSIKLAEILVKRFGLVMGCSLSKTKLVARGKKDRGGRSLWACKCPIVLTEPFDASSPEHLSRVNQLGIDGVADLYLESIKEYFA